MIKRISRILLVVLIGVLIVATPVRAISNPTYISFSVYNIFKNVLQTGDMLILAEGYVYYATEPTDYEASDAFIFELLNTSGNTTLASTTINDWGDRPVSIYLSASQVTTLGLASGGANKLRITGNPLIFGSPVGNSVNVTLTAEDYINQLLGVDNGVASNNPLRNKIVNVIAKNIQDYDNPTEDYVVTISGVKYLSSTKNPTTTSTTNTTTSSSGSTADTTSTTTGNTTTSNTTYSGSSSTGITTYTTSAFAGISGADIFLEGIPSLGTMCPIAFQSTLQVMSGDTPHGTGAYAATLTPAAKWGTTVATGLTNLGVYLGINQRLAGSLVLFVLVIMFAVFVYKATESGVVVLLMVAATPFVGAYLGLMPMALAFVFVIIIVTLLSYFFFSRGAL